MTNAKPMNNNDGDMDITELLSRVTASGAEALPELGNVTAKPTAAAFLETLEKKAQLSPPSSNLSTPPTAPPPAGTATTAAQPQSLHSPTQAPIAGMNSQAPPYSPPGTGQTVTAMMPVQVPMGMPAYGMNPQLQLVQGPNGLMLVQTPQPQATMVPYQMGGGIQYMQIPMGQPQGYHIPVGNNYMPVQMMAPPPPPPPQAVAPPPPPPPSSGHRSTPQSVQGSYHNISHQRMNTNTPPNTTYNQSYSQRPNPISEHRGGQCSVDPKEEVHTKSKVLIGIDELPHDAEGSRTTPPDHQPESQPTADSPHRVITPSDCNQSSSHPSNVAASRPSPLGTPKEESLRSAASAHHSATSPPLPPPPLPIEGDVSSFTFSSSASNPHGARFGGVAAGGHPDNPIFRLPQRCICTTAFGRDEKTTYRCPMCPTSGFLSEYVVRSHLKAKHGSDASLMVRPSFAKMISGMIRTFLADDGPNAGGSAPLSDIVQFALPPDVASEIRDEIHFEALLSTQDDFVVFKYTDEELQFHGIPPEVATSKEVRAALLGTPYVNVDGRNKK